MMPYFFGVLVSMFVQTVGCIHNVTPSGNESMSKTAKYFETPARIVIEVSTPSSEAATFAYESLFFSINSGDDSKIVANRNEGSITVMVADSSRELPFVFHVVPNGSSGVGGLQFLLINRFAITSRATAHLYQGDAKDRLLNLLIELTAPGKPLDGIVKLVS